jgi:hypothetical protein
LQVKAKPEVEFSLFKISILGLTNRKFKAPDNKLKKPIPTSSPRPNKIEMIMAMYVVLT